MTNAPRLVVRRTVALGRLALSALLLAAAGCTGGGRVVPPTPSPSATPVVVPAGFVAVSSVVTASTGTCSISWDGFIWYAVPQGSFPPIDAAIAKCAPAGRVLYNGAVIAPTWARVPPSTHTLFAVASLQEAHSRDGMSALAATAHAHGAPVTWMIGNRQYLDGDSDLYGAYHAQFGDDVQLEPDPSLATNAATRFSWFVPAVSVEGAGRERGISALLGRGLAAFWGITWNSDGTDRTADRGAPWGSYCADETSYKRPTVDGSCGLVSLEWTARDLTRAYFSGREDAFSTDPDDIVVRAGFSQAAGQAYARSLVDAYAAAGTNAAIVMIAQQESAEMNGVDAAVLDAMYDEAARDGMKLTTLAEAARESRLFASAPRAVAFPYVSGFSLLDAVYRGATVVPATIDFHDDAAGMTFVAGHTTPSRTFQYAAQTSSVFDVPLPLAPTPQLTAAALIGGTLALHFVSPVPMHYGIALWADPAKAALSGPHATPAGAAGTVATFDLPEGPSDVVVPCTGCTSTTFLAAT